MQATANGSLPRYQRMISGGVLLMASLLVGVHYTGALFTDTQSLGTNNFISGTVDISTSPGSALFNLSGIAPGDLATAALTVTNSGSLQMRYAVKSTTSEAPLAGALTLNIRSGVSSCTTPGFLLTGTPLYSGVLGGLGGLNVIGDVAPGAQAGDRILNGGSSENLCVQVALPLGTGNLLQGLTDLASLDFVAEQVANNP